MFPCLTDLFSGEIVANDLSLLIKYKKIILMSSLLTGIFNTGLRQDEVSYHTDWLKL